MKFFKSVALLILLAQATPMLSANSTTQETTTTDNAQPKLNQLSKKTLYAAGAFGSGALALGGAIMTGYSIIVLVYPLYDSNKRTSGTKTTITTTKLVNDYYLILPTASAAFGVGMAYYGYKMCQSCIKKMRETNQENIESKIEETTEINTPTLATTN